MTNGDRFTLEGKALSTTVATNGDLIIEGLAAVWDGLDREDENFAPGAFERGVKSFLSGQAGLCYHHKHDKLLGRVLELRETPEGLWMKARVDGAIKTHPELSTYYEQIKAGSLNALSVGGFFKRKLTAAGRRIVGVDFTEISVTPVPVHPGTRFSVVEGKALDGVDRVLYDLERLEAKRDVQRVLLDLRAERAELLAEQLLRL